MAVKTERGDAAQFTCVSVLEALNTCLWWPLNFYLMELGKPAVERSEGRTAPAEGTPQKTSKWEGGLVVDLFEEWRENQRFGVQ